MNYNENFSLEPINYLCEIDQVWKVEEFRPIKEYNGAYDISNLGRIKSLNYKKRLIPKIMKVTIDTKGYCKVNLCNNSIVKNKRIHQLVAIAFLNHILCGHKLVINHKNFNKTDNRLSNLEIVSSRENSNRKHLKSSSKYTGVSWNKRNKKWMSYVVFKGKMIYLGYFTTEDEASEYYENALISIKKGKNIKIKKHTYSSNYKGVCWDKKNKKWKAQIKHNKKTKFLGLFNTEIEAYNSYKKAINTL